MNGNAMNDDLDNLAFVFFKLFSQYEWVDFPQFTRQISTSR
jgi:hypothetical protein